MFVADERHGRDREKTGERIEKKNWRADGEGKIDMFLGEIRRQNKILPAAVSVEKIRDGLWKR